MRKVEEYEDDRIENNLLEDTTTRAMKLMRPSGAVTERMISSLDDTDLDIDPMQLDWDSLGSPADDK